MFYCRIGFGILNMDKKYYRLKITANDPNTKIWVGDDQGHLVVAETGEINEGLLSGCYTVSFGLGNMKHDFCIEDHDLTFNESDF